jgi:hypothetical protein
MTARIFTQNIKNHMERTCLYNRCVGMGSGVGGVVCVCVWGGGVKQDERTNVD